jgi:hypothetical protein
MPFILEDLEVYVFSEKLGNKIWVIVMEWDFCKIRIGKTVDCRC